MKKRNFENAAATYARTNLVVGAEKSAMSEDCKKIALRDFTRVAQEYFDLKTPVFMEVTAEAGEYAVSLNFKADRVKTFYLLK